MRSEHTERNDGFLDHAARRGTEKASGVLAVFLTLIFVALVVGIVAHLSALAWGVLIALAVGGGFYSRTDAFKNSARGKALKASKTG
jgi:hypothetical protein